MDSCQVLIFGNSFKFQTKFSMGLYPGRLAGSFKLLCVPFLIMWDFFPKDCAMN